MAQTCRQEDTLIEEPRASSSPETVLAPRLLAAFVDYLVVTAMMFLSLGFLPHSDHAFFFSAVASAAYFTLFHSKLFGGATLGKRTFGLRVFSLNGAGDVGLPMRQSFIRYFLLFGIPILLAEVPTLLLRNNAVIAPRYILELNMLFAMMYFCVVFLVCVTDKERRGFHDRLSGSRVLRSRENTTQVVAESLNHKRVIASILFGIGISSLAWLLGQFGSKDLRTLGSYRFFLESQLPIRITSIEESDEGLDIFVIRSDPSEKPELILRGLSEALASKIPAEPNVYLVFQDAPLRGGLTPKESFLRLLVPLKNEVSPSSDQS